MAIGKDNPELATMYAILALASAVNRLAEAHRKLAEASNSEALSADTPDRSQAAGGYS
ncbi:hypothetical protein [Nonomuraea rosea]|uniref:hypothetical protein n=1 Tax=Nonomuraea rosea TaxID=638574 RepID=UPI0031EB704B